MPKNMPGNVISRRAFMRMSGGCAAMTSTSLLATLLNLRVTNAVMAQSGDLSGYKALVCLFQFGGNDSYNMLTPYETHEYNDYVTARGGVHDPETNPTGLALAHEQLLDIQDDTGRPFGIHPGMPEVQQLYNDANLAFVANVGSLIEPTSLGDFQARRNLPLGLFSHSDEQRNWQTAIPQTRSLQLGWAGRIADVLRDSVNRNPAIAMNIALNSLNVLQTGNDVTPYVISTNGATRLAGYTNNNPLDRILRSATDSLLAQTYANLFEQTHADRRRNAIDAASDFNRATSAVTLDTTFPDTSLGNQLAMVAKTIGARAALGQTRQIFLVSRGGWDNHQELINAHAALLPEVSQALQAFYNATVELGVANEVTTFTASDFGRTLTSNGRGSDHAWAGNHIVMGGGVQGGNVYGRYPASLLPGNALDTGRGRLIPTTAVDEYAAELALWFGLANDNNLEIALPNIRNFFPAGASGGPLAFLT